MLDYLNYRYPTVILLMVKYYNYTGYTLKKSLVR